MRFRLTPVLLALALTAPCAQVLRSQQSQRSPKAAPPESSARQKAVSTADWAPELLYAMWSSPNAEAGDGLERAAFAAGSAIIPQLEAALKDDRTATFAAQALADLGGEKALQVLSTLVKDPRNLDLRLYYYGALGESNDPQATATLLNQIEHSDAEPDRAVTQAAILALTVRTDLSLIPRLKNLETEVRDVAIQDDLQNAMDIIRIRAKALATPQWKNSGDSLDQTIRAYFIPGLQPPPSDSTAAQAGPAPPTKLNIERVVFSPNRSRALARVTFEIPTAVATYDMVLQKKGGEWALASVWLGNEMEKPATRSKPAKP